MLFHLDRWSEPNAEPVNLAFFDYPAGKLKIWKNPSSSTMLTWRRSGCTASASRSWPDRSSSRGDTARSTSSTPDGFVVELAQEVPRQRPRHG